MPCFDLSPPRVRHVIGLLRVFAVNTGRFHGVEPYGQGGEGSDDGPAFRLSGQCWLSYRQGKALRMWV